MSRLLRNPGKAFKRIGKTPLKFQFDITVHKVEDMPEGPRAVFVEWKRGPKLAMTKAGAVSGGCAVWNEELSLICTLYRDAKTNVFEEKPSKLTLKETVRRGTSTVSYAFLDLATMASVSGREQKQLRLKGRGGVLTITVACQWLKDYSAPKGSSRSEISDFSAVSFEDDRASTMSGSSAELTSASGDDPWAGITAADESPAPRAARRLSDAASPTHNARVNTQRLLDIIRDDARSSPRRESVGRKFESEILVQAERERSGSGLREAQLAQAIRELKREKEELAARVRTLEGEKRVAEDRLSHHLSTADHTSTRAHSDVQAQLAKANEETERLRQQVLQLTLTRDTLEEQRDDLQAELASVKGFGLFQGGTASPSPHSPVPAVPEATPVPTSTAVPADSTALHAANAALEEEVGELARQLIESKMGWAQAEEDKELLSRKVREQQRVLRRAKAKHQSLAAEMTSLEVQLVAANNKIGELIR